MSLEDASGRRSASPSGSGRSSPIPRAARREGESGLYRADKSLRRYAVTIERALASWEISPEEWADYIAFLGRLLKAIQTHPKDVPVLPHSNEIATRLAQCLNPVLPSGVHQKALEVYAYIFSTFGSEYVSSHLAEFLPGLSAVLAFASLSVRPGLYILFENYIVKLPPSILRNALKSIILSVLPALEEESGEDFERALNIIQSLQSAFVKDSAGDEDGHESDGYFWQCFFLAVVTSPSRRQGALNYLSRNLPSLASRAQNSVRGEKGLPPAAECVVSPEPGLLIRCFVCGLSDPQMLVQRGFLDLLVAVLPLSSVVLQKRVGDDDLDRLVSAATLVLLRKDMSLNRRLWTWFLGPESKDQNRENDPSSPSSGRKSSQNASGDSQLRYFSSHGRSSLRRCVLKMLQSPNTAPSSQARPFRICLSLMDRWEIGGLLVPDLFLPAMESLHRYSLHAPAVASAEVIRSASLFFDGVEAALIWERLLSCLHGGIDSQKDADTALPLFLWLITSFNIKDEEMISIHIPQALMYLCSMVTNSGSVAHARLQLLEAVSHLMKILIDSGILSGIGTNKSRNTVASPREMSDQEIQAAVLGFYQNTGHSNERSSPPFDVSSVLPALFSRLFMVLSNASVRHDSAVFIKTSSLLVELLSRIEGTALIRHSELEIALSKMLLSTNAEASSLPFPVIVSTISFLASLRNGRSKESLLDDNDLIPLEPALTAQLWKYMSPSLPKYHVEAVKAFWQLEELVSPADAAIVSVVDLLTHTSSVDTEGSAGSVESFRRFCVLWGHTIAPNSKAAASRRGSSMSTLSDTEQMSRYLQVLEQPLMLVLDMLGHADNPAFNVVKSWLENLPSLEQILQLIISRLGEVLEKQSLQHFERASERRSHDDSLRELDYILGHIERLLRHSTEWTWRCLSRIHVPQVAGFQEQDGCVFLVELCSTRMLSPQHSSRDIDARFVSILECLLSSSATIEPWLTELENTLLDRIQQSIVADLTHLQGRLLRALSTAFKKHKESNSPKNDTEINAGASINVKRPSTASSRPQTNGVHNPAPQTPPPQLFKCLQAGLASSRSRLHLDQWLAFLTDVLPIFSEALLANLLPLIECICGELARVYNELVQMSKSPDIAEVVAPESTMMLLLEALEVILDQAYDCLLKENSPEPTVKSSEQSGGFLSNVASGVFKVEAAPSRTAKANSRLTVVLAFQDTIDMTLTMWLWANHATDQGEADISSSATTTYNALKVRNKTRHLQEQIFIVEPLESLEVIMVQWCKVEEDAVARSMLSLLHVMQATKPKNVVPAILDALCSRTNPSALPPARLSSQTLDLSASDVATFFSAYVDSTEDDAMDEIWPDCITFLRDVLANPLPYRQVLPHLLSIVLLLAEKLSNTNFGEQRKMRRDLGDVFQRLLTATFTTLPSGYIAESVLTDDQSNNGKSLRRLQNEEAMSLVSVLNRVIAKSDLILETSDRMTTAINNISASLISPTFRAKSFPRNVSLELLNLLVQVAQKLPTGKIWRKDVADAFSDPKILASPPELVSKGWYPVLHQWSLHDKERMPELLSRLTPPSSAGIMFGVGASAARLEADRRTQLNLRRICLLLLSSPMDTYVMQLKTIDEKLAELFEVSTSSSPSTNIKAELFMLFRAVAVSTSPVHLAPLWPVVNDKLQSAFGSLFPGSAKANEFNNLALLQACKLLDQLIALSPDEFQLHEWLYITDTIDAVYQPSDWTPMALADELAEVLRLDSTDDTTVPLTPATSGTTGQRKLLLGDELAVDKGDIRALPRDEFTKAVLRPFFSQLSIHAYEGVYSMDVPDSAVFRENVLSDLLDLGTIVE